MGKKRIITSRKRKPVKIGCSTIRPVGDEAPCGGLRRKCASTVYIRILALYLAVSPCRPRIELATSPRDAAMETLII